MAAAILALSVGAMLVYSALKNVPLTEVLSGKSEGDPLDGSVGQGIFGQILDSVTPSPGAVQSDGTVQNAQGENAASVGTVEGGNWTAPGGGQHSFKGPRASLLNKLAGIGQNDFHLTITATTNGGHVSGSYHYQGRAFDISGSAADMNAFAKYLYNNYSGRLTELIHNNGGAGYAVKDGKKVNGKSVYAAVWAGHANHVHVAA